MHRQRARTIRSLLRSVRELDTSLSLHLLGSLEDDVAERILTRLPGLSWKGSRCVLLCSLGGDDFPVDSSTFRISKRIAVIHLTAIYRRRELYDARQGFLPPKRRRSLHVSLGSHGKCTSVPLRPRCQRGPLRAMCPRIGVTEIGNVAPIPIRGPQALHGHKV